jgi:hypothetical protein
LNVAPEKKPRDKPLTPRQAWQPFTPRGVAAFAFASGLRLTLLQLMTAALVAAAVVTFLRSAWFPVIEEAISELPRTGSIRNGLLDYPGPSTRLAENSRLAVSVGLENSTTRGHVADLEVVFGRGAFLVCGALGCESRSYLPGYIVSFNRPELEPAWGAWRGPVQAIAAGASGFAVLVSWWILSVVYAPVVKLIAFFADRVVTWSGAYRLSGAALVPGAWLMAAAIVLYGMGGVDLPRFALLYVLHGITGLALVTTAPFFLPKIPRSGGRAANPFGSRR